MDYFTLIKNFYKVFQHKFDEYVDDIHKFKYIDPNMNYDEYCDYVKKVEQVKSILTFFINLMKTNICSLDNIVNMCLLLQKKIIVFCLIYNKFSGMQPFRIFPIF